MRRRNSKGNLWLSSVLLAICMLLMVSGCGQTDSDGTVKIEAEAADTTAKETEAIADVQAVAETEAGAQTEAEPTVLGEGDHTFMFHVVDGDGNETVFEIHTDETNVGAALLGLGLIAGEDGSYGLYVKEVNGITADYDRDGTYWAFYVDGEYASAGVDAMEISEGASYSFKVEK